MGKDMFKGVISKAAPLIIIGFYVPLAFFSSGQIQPAQPGQVKELNFVFLHGAGSDTCTFQLLDDCLIEQLPAYIIDYEKDNTGTMIQYNTLKRCYPGFVDIESWANNIASSINEYFEGKKNLILIGHSMGGKAALYAVANNIGNLADRVLMVVTINSPVKSLNKYYISGGGSVLQYARAIWFWPDEGVTGSVTYYDSSEDGLWVGSNRHWLAFISSEDTPLSEQFNVSGVDAWPRDMDDSVVPISAQYSDGADVIHYGTCGHSDFASVDEVAEFIADQILRYLFGGDIECSVFARGGITNHEAGWLPGIDQWEDVVGGIPAVSGTVLHKNESYYHWQDWEDTVGQCPPEVQRDSYYISQVNSLPILTGIVELRWFTPDDPEDCRLYLRTRAAPRNSIQVNWSIHQKGLLPEGVKRDHYEVKIITGTPLTSIKGVSWETYNPRDLRLRILSEAERPFRWFKAEWRVYFKETRQKKVIDEIPGQALLGQVLSSR